MAIPPFSGKSNSSVLTCSHLCRLPGRNMRQPVPNMLRRRPWLPILLAFLAFIGLWIWFITFSGKHRPETIPYPKPPASTGAPPSRIP